jgi:hypothetical protein
MWRSVAIGVVLAGLLAGCSWGGASGAASSTHQAATNVVLTVGVGDSEAKRSDVGTVVCPAGAQCFAVALHNTTPTRWMLAARRRLSCDPGGGDYSDAAGACRALADFLKGWPFVACGCVAVVGIDYTIIGRVDGRTIRKRFTDCTLCNAPPRIRHDIAVLFPR